MSRFALPAALAFALAASPLFAQPTGAADEANRAVNVYLYMMDAAGHKALVSTQLWRNDVKYDERVVQRFLEVLAGLEKRGFRKNDKATITSWDKPDTVARCYVYLEDLQAGKKTKTSVTSGARVWCSDSGISESEINPSDQPKHAEQVLSRFDGFLAKAKQNLKK